MANRVRLDSWYGDLAWLSPNFETPIVYNGISYLSLRNAYEATKHPATEDRIPYQKMNPWDAIQTGKDYPVEAYKNEWESNIQTWILEFLLQKFGLTPGKGNRHTNTKLAYWLCCTENSELIYTNTFCDQLLGICNCPDHAYLPGLGRGQNLLGQLTEIIRSRLEPKEDDPCSTDCDWCFNKRKYNLTPAVEMMVWYVNGRLVRKAVCKKHRGVYYQVARREADKGVEVFPITDTAEISEAGHFLFINKQEQPLILHPPTCATYVHHGPINRDKSRWGISVMINNQLEHSVIGMAR